MAVSSLCGFETGSVEEAFSLTNSGLAAAPSVQSTTKRSGGYALSCEVRSSTTSYITLSSRAAAGTLRSIYQSVSFWFSYSLTTMTLDLGVWAAGVYELRISGTNANNDFRIFKSGSSIANGSVAIPSDLTQWHRIDIDIGYNAGAGIRAYCDRVLMVSADSEVISGFPATAAKIGCVSSSLTGTTNLFIDDVVTYDGPLPATLTDYSLSLLLPTSDNAVGNWRRNDNITATALWDAVNNTPPTGTAVTAVIASTYVQNGTAGSSVANDNLDLNCAAYTSVTGLTTASQVLAVMPLCNDAQQVTTGSPKSGAVAVASNPAVSDQSFDFGLPNGTAGSTAAAAQGAFPTGWGTHAGAVVEAPSLTMTSGPVVRVKRTGTYTRVISVDFAGVYVMWTPAVTPVPPGLLKAGALGRGLFGPQAVQSSVF